MSSYWCYVTLLSFALPVVFRTVVCERDSILYCGACIALVEEINWQTGTTDPKKKIQIGSYQLDSRGNMNAHEVPLARSEVHLTEVMEVVCRYMHYYAKNIDYQGHTNYIRTASRDGNEISKKHTENIEDIRNTLQFACDYVLEHHDDQLLKMYQAKEEEIAEKLCVDLAGLCTKQNVSDQMWAYASEIMLGMTEKAAASGDSKAADHLKSLENSEEDDDGDVDDEDVEEMISADDEDEESVDPKTDSDRTAHAEL